MAQEYLLVLTTCSDRETARRIAGELVGSGIAACVNIVPGAESVYLWQGELRQDRELVLLIKTVSTRLDAVGAAIRRTSGYELPEVLAVPVAGGSDEYLQWIAAAVEPGA